jgi:hypothetical protein
MERQFRCRSRKVKRFALGAEFFSAPPFPPTTRPSESCRFAAQN